MITINDEHINADESAQQGRIYTTGSNNFKVPKGEYFVMAITENRSCLYYKRLVSIKKDAN